MPGTPVGLFSRSRCASRRRRPRARAAEVARGCCDRAPTSSPACSIRRRLQLGAAVYVSAVVAAVAALPGVDAVERARGAAAQRPARAPCATSSRSRPDEVAVLDDDPARPGRGRLDVGVQAADDLRARRARADPGRGRPRRSCRPPPGEALLRRRVGDSTASCADLVARVEQLDAGACRWASAGTSRATRSRTLLVGLWAYVAEIVAAYDRADRGRGVPGDGARLDRPAPARRARRLPPAAAGRGAGLGPARRRQGRRPAPAGRHARPGAGHAAAAGADLRGARRTPSCARTGTA